jgi:hypothetical protein
MARPQLFRQKTLTSTVMSGLMMAMEGKLVLVNWDSSSLMAQVLHTSQLLTTALAGGTLTATMENGLVLMDPRMNICIQSALVMEWKKCITFPG